MSLIPKNSKILDAGCGPGQAAKRFAEKGHDATGIDLSRKMIEFAKQKAPNAKFLVMDLEELEIKEKFDGIWAAFVLVHIPREKHQKIINGFYTLLKPGGILYLGMIQGKGERLMEEPYNRNYKQWFVFVSKEEIEALLKKAGLELLKYSTEDFDEEGDNFILSSTFAKRKN